MNNLKIRVFSNPMQNPDNTAVIEIKKKVK